MKKIQSNIDTSDNHFCDQVQSDYRLMSRYYSTVRSATNLEMDSVVQIQRLPYKQDVRRRIELLMDQNNPFLELSPPAALGQYNKEFPSAEIIAFTGKIPGTLRIILTNDINAKRSRSISVTVKKYLYSQQNSIKNHPLYVYLGDSDVKKISEQLLMSYYHEGFGCLFHNAPPLSARGFHLISIAKGSFTREGAYVPSISAQITIMKKQVLNFILEPLLVKAATCEGITTEELGDTFGHQKISGKANHLTDYIIDTIYICRNISELIPQNGIQPKDKSTIGKPVYDPDELYRLSPTDPENRRISAKLLQELSTAANLKSLNGIKVKQSCERQIHA